MGLIAVRPITWVEKQTLKKGLPGRMKRLGGLLAHSAFAALSFSWGPEEHLKHKSQVASNRTEDNGFLSQQDRIIFLHCFYFLIRIRYHRLNLDSGAVLC